MQKYDLDKVRCVGIMGHGGVGKTTLLEAILFQCKITTRQGKIEDGNTVSDFLNEETAHHFSISAALAFIEKDGHKIHFLDCPGYADFIGEVCAGVRAVDTALIVVDGVAGIEVGTRNCWSMATGQGLAKVVFVNRLERENADFNRIVAQFKDQLGRACVPVALPVGQEADISGVVSLLKEGDVPDEIQSDYEQYREQLLESIAETDEELLEAYLENGTLTPEQISNGLKAAVSSGDIVPIIPGVAAKGLGAPELLDVIISATPSPVDRPPVSAKDGKDAELEVKPTLDEPFCGLVFKAMTDPYIGQLTYFRVFSGQLKSDSEFQNVTRSHKEKSGQIFLMRGKEQIPVDSVGPGDLAAIPKLKDTHPGDTICDARRAVEFKPILFPEPMVRLAIQPNSRKDEDKIGTALRRLSEEDPTFSQGRDPETREHVIKGMGDVHLNIMMERMKEKFSVQATTHLPKIAYKEAIKSKISCQGKYKKQTGGHGQYGDVHIEVSPLARGEGFEFKDAIVGGRIPKNYIPSVEKGVKEALSHGVIAGYPVVDIKVKLYDGSYHNVDSSDLAFQIAGSMAIQKAIKEARNCLLEPIMEVEVIVPEENMGDVTGSMSGRRGRILGMDNQTGMQVIKAEVPDAEMLTYSADLRSMTGGRGSFAMKFSRYEEVPEHQAQQIIESAKKEKEEASKS